MLTCKNCKIKLILFGVDEKGMFKYYCTKCNHIEYNKKLYKSKNNNKKQN